MRSELFLCINIEILRYINRYWVKTIITNKHDIWVWYVFKLCEIGRFNYRLKTIKQFCFEFAHSRCVKCSTESWHHSSAAVYLFLGRIIQKYLRKGHISIILSLKDKSFFLCSGCCASQSEIYVKSVPFYFRSKSNWQFAGQKITKVQSD